MISLNFKIKGSITTLPSGAVTSSESLLNNISSRVEFFRKSGIKSSMRVLLYHHEPINFFIDLFALWNIGASAIPVSTRSTKFELESIIKLTSPALALFSGPKPELQIPCFSNTDATLQISSHFFKTFKDESLILLTSGTLGRPKAVVHTYSSILNRINTLKKIISSDEMINTLSILPLHFGHGLIANSLFPLLSGANLFVFSEEPSRHLHDLGEIIDKHSITFMSSVPAHWGLIPKLSSPPQKDSLRLVHTASAPINQTRFNEIIAWTHAPLVRNVYGLSETASWVAGADNSNFIGTPWGADFSIKAGELYVKTSSMMLGYLEENNFLNTTCFKDSYFATGDLAEVRLDGTYSLYGRLKLEMNIGGIKVNPEEIERLLVTHHSIFDVCVFPLPHSISGEEVCAALVVKEETSPSEIEAFLLTKLTSIKIPRRWFFLESIPRNERGKINRTELFEIIEKIS